MSTKRKIDKTEEDERFEWLVYSGGIAEPMEGVMYTQIRVAEGTTRIDDNAFIYLCSWSNDNAPRRVEMCEGVKEIGEFAFDRCGRLGSVTFPSTLTSIASGAFCRCYSLKRVDLCEGLETIDDEVFSGCESLESINLPSTHIDIGERAFRDCKSLKSIGILPRVTTLMPYTFVGCTALKHVTLPSTLKEIHDRTFRGCTSLESINIPSSVIAICSGAFEGCKSLKEVTFHSSSCLNPRNGDLCVGSPKVARNAFDNCHKLEHGSIISTCKMDIHAFRRFARLDLSRRNGSMTDQHRAIIESKFNAIPDQIVEDPDSRFFTSDLYDDITDGPLYDSDAAVGRIAQSMQESLAKIHGLITYWELKEPTTIIELAIWKSNLDFETDAESRQRIRKQCGRDM